jgi:hypothetical protein
LERKLEQREFLGKIRNRNFAGQNRPRRLAACTSIPMRHCGLVGANAILCVRIVEEGMTKILQRTIVQDYDPRMLLGQAKDLPMEKRVISYIINAYPGCIEAA